MTTMIIHPHPLPLRIRLTRIGLRLHRLLVRPGLWLRVRLQALRVLSTSLKY